MDALGGGISSNIGWSKVISRTASERHSAQIGKKTRGTRNAVSAVGTTYRAK